MQTSSMQAPQSRNYTHISLLAARAIRPLISPVSQLLPRISICSSTSLYTASMDVP